MASVEAPPLDPTTTVSGSDNDDGDNQVQGDDDSPIPDVPDEDDVPEVNGEAGDEDEGLFGEGEDDEPEEQTRKRTLDDQELDSGDEIDREDRVPNEQADDQDQEQEQVLNREPAQIATHPLPQGSDGELYLLKVPKFLALEPGAFSANNFRPPTTDHHSAAPPSSEFSVHKTAMKTIRWRRSPHNSARLQSNARILRWSDGSLTLQLATDPTTQYLLPGKPRAPAQVDPKKPTPTSVTTSGSKARKLNTAPTTGHKSDLESFTYLSSAAYTTAVIRTTNKITTSLVVEPSKDASDDAVARLQTRLAAGKASKDGESNGMLGGLQTTNVIQDPELAQKAAEKAEKESAKLQRRRENQEAREKERNIRALGRRGVGAGGLTVGGLEGEEDELGMGIRRVPTGARKPKKRSNRTGEIYSDSDEGGVRGRTKEDEYDEEDDFVAGSDEEEEIIEDDDEEEEDIDEKIEKEERRRGQKRSTPDEEADQDAEGEPDDETPPNAASAGAPGEGSPLARNKRRRVIEDDDEEE